jgi:alpha-tubulin suppressor-like RCC1 family protein
MKGCRKLFGGGILCALPAIWLWLGTSAGAAGLVGAWGNNDYGQTTMPLGLGQVRAVTAGARFSAALKVDGTVTVWGDPAYGITNLPVGLNNVKAISAGTFHMLALKADGSVVAWGSNLSGETTVPSGLSGIVAVAACVNHNLALKFDGSVVAWGNNDHGQTNVLSALSNVVAVAGGSLHSLALKADGTVVMWGDNTYGQTNPPDGLSNIVAIAAGDYHSLALRSDGAVLAWGDGSSGQTNVPVSLSNVVALAAGPARSLALQGDGSVIIWGAGSYGEGIVPVGVSATAIAAGAHYNLVLTPAGPVQILQNPQSQVVTYSSNGTLTVTASGNQPVNYQWRFNGSNLADNAHLNGTTNSTLTINNLQFSDTGSYSVLVSNALGSVVSSSAVLTVVSPPLILQQSASQTVRAGSDLTFSATFLGSPVLVYQWRFNGTDIPGATRNFLSLTNVQSGMSGSYVLQVTNSYGIALTSPMLLTVTDSPPYILLQPTNQSSPVGGNAAFSVNVRGSLPLVYQWRFNGADIPGATNPVLAFNNLAFGQTGFYDVAITNSFGEVISSKVFLSVFEVAVLGSGSTSIPTNVPPGLSNLVAISAGNYHMLGLKADGTVLSWASGFAPNLLGAVLTNLPAGLTNVVAISAGGNVNMALKANGRVVVWGDGSFGLTNVPPGVTNLSGIAAGAFHCLALKSNGTVAAWGGNVYGQTNVPAGLSNVTSVAAGTYSSMALRTDGTVVVWGGNSGESKVPAGMSNVVAIAAGSGSCLALKVDGTLVQWGQQNTIPPARLSNVVAIAEGGINNIALKNDGTAVTWADPRVIAIPVVVSNIFALAAGSYENRYYAVLVGDGSPKITLQPVSQSVARGASVQLTSFAVGMQPMSYQWQHDGLSLPGATNSSLMLTNFQGADIGGYRLMVANALGMTNSASAFLDIPFTNSLAQALDATNLRWSVGIPATNAPWFSQLKVSHDGDGAAQSGAITNNQQTSLETTVVGPGTLSFWWKVSSEEGFDFLKFAINDVVLTSAAISGEVDWEQRTFKIPAFQHLLIWTYSKDASVSEGQDAGWLDQVVYTPDPVTILQQPSSQTVFMGTNVTLSIQATSTVAVTYQWLKNGTNLNGATQSRLVLQSVTQNDAGSYQAKVSNGGLTAVSSNALLSVITPQILGISLVLPDGSFSLTSRFADGTQMGSNLLGAFQLQASGDLSTWVTLTNAPVLTNGMVRFVVPGSPNYTRRFYRVIQSR